MVPANRGPELTAVRRACHHAIRESRIASNHADCGWADSFYGDLHIQGREGVQFYTQQKVITTRWLGDGAGDVWKK